MDKERLSDSVRSRLEQLLDDQSYHVADRVKKLADDEEFMRKVWMLGAKAIIHHIIVEVKMYVASKVLSIGTVALVIVGFALVAKGMKLW